MCVHLSDLLEVIVGSFELGRALILLPSRCSPERHHSLLSCFRSDALLAQLIWVDRSDVEPSSELTSLGHLDLASSCLRQLPSR